ncbi:glycosyltransferase family 4 protein [Candidatus Woesearchaeota archaeon]|nr:glycosyltransferase family 4 protein [Candidatus Woesearchaeota archaeon]
MNILFVVENYYPHIGGVEVIFKNLAEGLAAKGHKVVVLTHRLKGTKRHEFVKGVTIRRVDCFGSRYLFTFFAIPEARELAEKADIIHTTTFNGAPPAWVAAKSSGRPLVITVHEVWIGMWKRLGDMSWLGKRMHDFLERMIYLLRYDFYAAVSESTKKQLIRIGIPEKKVKVVYNSVDYEHFKAGNKGREKIRKKHALKGFVYLAYGRPGVSKGLEYAVRAVKIIKKNIPDSKFVLILSTDPAYRKQYRKILRLIRKLKLLGDIVLLPPVKWKELPNYLKAADCIVVPSLAEGFGYTAAEAAALDVPVVATDTTSLPEVVSGKHILVKPKSPVAIAEAVEDVYRHKFKVKKKKLFRLEDNIKGYLEIYGQLLNKKLK